MLKSIYIGGQIHYMSFVLKSAFYSFCPQSALYPFFPQSAFYSFCTQPAIYPFGSLIRILFFFSAIRLLSFWFFNSHFTLFVRNPHFILFVRPSAIRPSAYPSVSIRTLSQPSHALTTVIFAKCGAFLGGWPVNPSKRNLIACLD